MVDNVTLFSSIKDEIIKPPSANVKKEMRHYQTKLAYDISKEFQRGLKSVLAQAATGSGKTVTFCTIAKRYWEKNKKPILVLVHREELLYQTLSTLYAWHSMTGFALTPNTKKPPYDWPVQVAMTETLFKRAKKWGPEWCELFGMVIIDEAHLAIHQKSLAHFPNALKIGFSATPVSSSKKNPLNKHFESIVCSIDIPELIEEGSLCHEICYSLPQISEEELEEHVGKNGDYDDAYQGAARSGGKQLLNTLKNYQLKADGTKAIIFNATVDHSEKVCETFCEAGYDCRHLDGSTEKELRKEILHWFKVTPGAILCNVAVATTGFDEPTIQTVIFNKDTKSLSLWLQASGRGGRVIKGVKSSFILIDMGNNVARFGKWSTPHDWIDLFKNPGKPKTAKLQVAPTKVCPHCSAIVNARAQKCEYCGVSLALPIVYDGRDLDVVLIDIDVKAMHRFNMDRGKKLYSTFFQIGKELARKSNNYDELIVEYTRLAQIFCECIDKPFRKWHVEKAEENLRKEIELRYGVQNVK